MTTEADTESTKDSENSLAAPAPSHDSAAEPLPAPHEREHERELDIAEAERFADSIRPSWADAPPVPVSVPPTRELVAVGGTTRVVRHNTRTDMTAPRLRKQRGSAYLILGASLLGVCGVLYLGVASSRVKPSAAELAPAGLKRAQTAQQPAPTLVPPTAPLTAAQLAAAEPEPGSPALPGAEDLAGGSEDWAPEFSPQEFTTTDFAATTEPAELPTQEGVESSAAAALNPAVADEQPSAALAPVAAEAPAAIAAAEVPAPAPSAPPLPEAPAAVSDAPAAPPSAAAQPQVAEAPAAAIGAAVAAAPAAKQDAVEAIKPAPARPAERAKQVILSLQAYPPNTRLKLDGAQIDNPFRGRLPRSSKHRIEAAAPGFAPETHVLRLEADVQLMLSLKRDQVRDVKADPYRDQRRSASVAPQTAKRDRGAGFVAENPY